MQIKKIADALSGGKRTRLTIQQPRHVRILNFSSGFASLLRRVREVFHRSAGAQCRPKIGGFQFGRGGGKPQLQAQLRVTAESSTATAAQHSHLSQLSDGATLPLADTADTAESTDTV